MSYNTFLCRFGVGFACAGGAVLAVGHGRDGRRHGRRRRPISCSSRRRCSCSLAVGRIVDPIDALRAVRTKPLARAGATVVERGRIRRAPCAHRRRRLRGGRHCAPSRMDARMGIGPSRSTRQSTAIQCKWTESVQECNVQQLMSEWIPSLSLFSLPSLLYCVKPSSISSFYSSVRYCVPLPFLRSIDK